MAYLIIGLVLLFIIAPIVSVLPSARQKEQMKMRTEARHAGVNVELTRIDDPNPRQDKYISNLGKAIEPIVKVAAWRKPRQRPRDWRELPDLRWSLSRIIDKGWQWDAGPPAGMHPALQAWLPEAVAELPEDVERVEETGFVISVYWHERKLESAEDVIRFLQACADQPLMLPPSDEDS